MTQLLRCEMMQGVSVSSVAASAKGGNCGKAAFWQRSSKGFNKSNAKSWVGGLSLWRQCVLKLFITSSHRSKQARYYVKAAWLFNQSSRGMDANSERSESANEDILIFFFQLDLQTRVQYALNMEQYDVAQQLRNKLSEVETEIIKQREAKRGSSSKSEVQDKAINVLRLRADMQKAIECENYTLAANLRDEISKIEAESLAASAKALAYENVQYMFRLGQKVKHKIFGIPYLSIYNILFSQWLHIGTGCSFIFASFLYSFELPIFSAISQKVK
uniref:Hydroxyacylglutathione hydrolase n=1 Tax=Anthurium amnicola TaxID=1678845 RepID=A0A1D1YVC9_9ARAE